MINQIFTTRLHTRGRGGAGLLPDWSLWRHSWGCLHPAGPCQLHLLLQRNTGVNKVVWAPQVVQCPTWTDFLLLGLWIEVIFLYCMLRLRTWLFHPYVVWKANSNLLQTCSWFSWDMNTQICFALSDCPVLDESKVEKQSYIAAAGRVFIVDPPIH